MVSTDRALIIKQNEYATHTRGNATWAVRRKKRPSKSWRESFSWATKWGLQSVPSILWLVKSSWPRLQIFLNPDHWLTLITHTDIHQGSCQICSLPIRKPIVRVIDACVSLTRSEQAAGRAKTLEPLLWALIRAGYYSWGTDQVTSCLVIPDRLTWWCSLFQSETDPPEQKGTWGQSNRMPSVQLLRCHQNWSRYSLFTKSILCQLLPDGHILNGACECQV